MRREHERRWSGGDDATISRTCEDRDARPRQAPWQPGRDPPPHPRHPARHRRRLARPALDLVATALDPGDRWCGRARRGRHARPSVPTDTWGDGSGSLVPRGQDAVERHLDEGGAALVRGTGRLHRAGVHGLCPYALQALRQQPRDDPRGNREERQAASPELGRHLRRRGGA